MASDRRIVYSIKEKKIFIGAGNFGENNQQFLKVILASEEFGLSPKIIYCNLFFVF
jgi:hypothetical protein